MDGDELSIGPFDLSIVNMSGCQRVRLSMCLAPCLSNWCDQLFKSSELVG